MRLTRSDLFATVLTAAIIGIYVGYRQGTGGWIISSTRATVAVVLAICIAVCLLGRLVDLYARGRSDTMAALAVSASVLGVIALGASIIGIASGAAIALALLVGPSVGLSSIVVLRRVLDVPPPGGQSRADQRVDDLRGDEYPETAAYIDDLTALRPANAAVPGPDAYAGTDIDSVGNQ
jgi:hypothetical protein